MGSIDLTSTPNSGSSLPKPKFLEDAALSEIIQRVIRDSWISSVNDLIVILNQTYEALEYCWFKLKRLQMIKGSKRSREWQELLLTAKRPRNEPEVAEIEPISWKTHLP